MCFLARITSAGRQKSQKNAGHQSKGKPLARSVEQEFVLQCQSEPSSYSSQVFIESQWPQQRNIDPQSHIMTDKALRIHISVHLITIWDGLRSSQMTIVHFQSHSVTIEDISCSNTNENRQNKSPTASQRYNLQAKTHCLQCNLLARLFCHQKQTWVQTPKTNDYAA